MTTYGLTPTGFVPKTAEIVRDEMRAGCADFGLVDTGDGSAAGELIGIVAAAAGELWEVGEQLASSTDRDSATGPRLDAIGALTGTIRKAATKSTVIATLTGDPLTVISDFTAATASTGAAFETDVETVLVEVDAWASSTAYAEGDRVTNASNVYQCITAGTSDSSGGPTGTSTSITDNTVEWAWLGEGTAAEDHELTAVDDGVVVATVRDLTVIQTPIAGLLNVTNLAEAEAGDTVESDAVYRIRQTEELAGAGAATAANIRALLLRLDGVTSAHVFFNNTATTDGDGVPPNSVEALVEGGDDQEIIDVLGEQVVAGIGTFGNTTGSHTDEEGTTFDVSFSRPDQILIYNRITLTKTATTYAGDTAAEDALLAYGEAEQVIGKDLIPTSAAAALLPVKLNGVQVAGVTGVLKIVRSDAYTDVIGTPVAWAPSTAYVATVGSRSVVTNNGRAYICTVGGTSAASGGPTSEGTAITDGGVTWRWLGNDIVISSREIAVLDASRIAISSSTATP